MLGFELPEIRLKLFCHARRVDLRDLADVLSLHQLAEVISAGLPSNSVGQEQEIGIVALLMNRSDGNRPRRSASWPSGNSEPC